MTVLSFDFSKSYRGVTHTQTYYQDLVIQLLTIGDGYNGKAIAHYVGTATLHHTSDGGTETIDDRSAFHPEAGVANSLHVSTAAVLAQSPTGDHYDLWQPTPGNSAGGMSLRVSADVPPPPVWSDYMKTDYYGDTESSSGYSADLQKYVAALLNWEFGDGWETSGGVDIPRTDATLRDGKHVLGTIHTDTAIDPKSFLDIANFESIVAGSQFKDTLEGGTFDDTLFGKGGNDLIHGLAGKDDIDGGSGKDTLVGNGGDDDLFGGGDNDLVDGGDDNDRIVGGNGADGLVGGAGNDHVAGGNGGDKLYGNTGDDKVEGGNANDKLYGAKGHDILQGDAGNDRLDGGVNADKLFGGNGKDQFVFSVHDSVDEIEDFEPGADKIVLLKTAFADIAKMNADAFHAGPHAEDASDRIIYWHNILYYDADGTKGGEEGFQQVAFAKIVNSAALTSTDFLLE